MSDFRLKLKKPGRIMTFDDSDLSDCLGSTESSSPMVSPPAMKSQAVLPKKVPNHLLLVSILEHLCHMYGKDTKQAQEIFSTICDQLSQAGVVSPLLILDEMSSLRAQYRLSVHKMLVAAIHKSKKSFRLELQGAKGSALPAITYSLPCELPSNPEELVNQTSRYKSEFVEIERIGKGGFGSVYKSRNKLDGNLYAVKKVKFKHSKPEVWYKVLREVKALAYLHHYNVVGYNAAWLEYEPIKLVQTDLPTEAEFGDTNDGQSLDDIIFQDSENGFYDYHPGISSLRGPKIREITSDISESESSISFFTNDFSISSQNKQFIQNKSATDNVEISHKQTMFETEFFSNLTSSRHTETRSSISTAFNKHLTRCSVVNQPERRVEFSLSGDVSDSLSKNFHTERRRYGRSISCDPHAIGETNSIYSEGKPKFVESDFALKQSVTLYIQMELCDTSLKEWLQKRNYTCKSKDEFTAYQDKNMTIFRQILKGIDFIHSQGIIHRDVKPRNIFLIEGSTGSIHVKIGDFGLATDDSETLASPTIKESNLTRAFSSGKLTRTESNVSDHTSGVGTSTYAAPEQLEGSFYNSKSDIYSLGIVLYELFMQFKTESERIRCLDGVRKGLIDDSIFNYWPAQAHCIEHMTLYSPEQRPSIKDLLHGELFLSKDQIIEDQRAKISSQQSEIERLKKLLSERDKTLEELVCSEKSFGSLPGLTDL